MSTSAPYQTIPEPPRGLSGGALPGPRHDARKGRVVPPGLDGGYCLRFAVWAASLIST